MLYFSLIKHLPSITSPPPTKEWMEINIPPDLCVGTVRRALSKVERTLMNEMENLKKEGDTSLAGKTAFYF